MAIQTQQPTCEAPAGGSITVTGSEDAVAYSIDGGDSFQTSNVFTGLSVGSYAVVVGGEDECVSATQEITLVGPTSAPRLAAASVAADTCNLGTGVALLTPSSGDAPYTITLGTATYTDVGPAGQRVGGLAGGDYTATVRDGGGCVATVDFTVEAVAGPAIDDFSITPPTCATPTGGTIAIEASSTGETTLAYSIDGGETFQSEASFTGLGAGTYVLAVRGPGACVTVGETVTFEDADQERPRIVEVLTQKPTCSAPAGGTIQLQAEGSGLAYSIDGGETYQADPRFGGLAAGSYTAVVRNSDGCESDPAPVLLAAPEDAPQISSVETDPPTCTDLSAGVIVIEARGTGLTYSIDGGSSFGDEPTFRGLAAGVYRVVVRSGEGCLSDVREVTLEGPGEAPEVLTQVLAVDSCANGVGRLRITATGGRGPYTASLDGRALGDVPAEGLLAEGLSGGVYAVTLTDANGCSAAAEVEIVSTRAPVILDFRTAAATCDDLSGGAITVFATGDGKVYSVDGGMTFSTGQTTRGLAAGSYVLVVRASNGCVSAPVEVIVDGPADVPAVDLTDVRADTCGRAVGGFSVLPQGATPLSFTINDGPVRELAAGGEKLGGLSGGVYVLVFSTGEGCSVTRAVTVPEVGGPDLLGVDATAATCAEPQNGRLDVRAEGEGLRYAIDGETFQASPTFTGLAPGEYRVTVRGVGGCETVSEPVTLIDPERLRPRLSIGSTVLPTCDDLTGGRISVRATGTGVRYSSDGGLNYQDAPDFGGLRAGTYTVLARTSEGCVSEPLTVTLDGPVTGAPVIGSVETAPANCDDLSAGIIRVIAEGSGLSFSIDGGARFRTSNQFDGLPAGTYVVTVRNAGGCEAQTAPIVIGGPTSLPQRGDVVATNTSCRGAADGVLRIEGVSGGTAPYQYALAGRDDLPEDNTFVGLPAGTYTLRLTDANGCSVTQEATVEDGPDIGLQLGRTDNPTCGASNGRISVSVAVGEATYSWSDGGRGASRDNLPADRYVVTATTPGGCRDSLVIILNDVGAPRLTVEEVAPDRCGEATGVISVGLSDGQAPFTYHIDGRRTGAVTRGLAAGTYRVDVTDANGCSAAVTAEVPSVGLIDVVTTDTVACGTERVEVFASVTLGEASTYAWSNGDTGPSTRLEPGQSATVTVTSPEGCTATATASVDFGGADGEPTVAYAPGCGPDPSSATVTVEGFGQRDSLYVFDGRTQSSPVFVGVGPGKYDFGVLLTSGCLVEATVTLRGAPPIQAVVVDTAYANCLPLATVRGSGGAGAPYTFSLDGATFSADSVFAVGEPRTVLVRDREGCLSDAITIDLPAPQAPSATAAVTYEGCEEATGTVQLSAGATPTLTYVWDDGFEGAFRQNLPSGAYGVTVTDPLTECTATLSVEVERVGALGLEVAEVTPAKDCQAPDGTLSVRASGGVAPFTYRWSHDATVDSARAVGLAAGTYAVTATDARGCTQQVDFTVPGEAGVRLGLVASTPVSCAGGANGVVTVEVTAPDPGSVRLRWADGSTAVTRADLRAGTYTITATDGENCTDTVRVEVGDDRLRIDSAAVTSAGCDSTGAVDLTLAGGRGSYRATWSDGLGGLGRMGLAGGTYAVRLQDGAGCVVDTAIVVEGATVEVLADSSVTLCPGGVRAFSVDYPAAEVTWTDDTGLLLAVDSTVFLDRAGVYTYEVAGLGVCGGRGTVTVEQSGDALFAQFLIASAAVAGAEVVAVETSVPAPTGVAWRVEGPGVAASLGGVRNEWRWRFDEPGTYAVTLEATLGTCMTSLTKTVEIVADSSLLPEVAPAFGELTRLAVAPNPTRGPFTVEVDFTAPRPISVRVYAMDGRLVSDQTEAPSDAHRVSLDIGGELAGNYFVVVTAGVGSWTRAVVLVE